MESRVSYREFDDFRKEIRDSHKSLELKLWGVILAEFLIMVGYLISRIQAIQEAPVPAPVPAAAIVWRMIERMWQ